MKMKVQLCRHLKTNGTQCQSPAMQYGGSSYCYFHDRLHERHKRFRYTEETKGYLIRGRHIQLHPVEDAESIQLAISLVVNALATGDLEPQRATALLYGLQLASTNARTLAPKPKPEEIVRTIATSPDGLDIAFPSTYLALTPDKETAERLQREYDFIRLHGLKEETAALPDDTA
ncbi:hypothetical protein [Edaphobacter bradus]|uniref:hypothetical protein n=1 Tax=Edaphobacter bradus TaxID=2259016 RepID=UPI0021E015D3|nr:hypothetical protein [Edaphobacter bradus]